jgi:leader peptidase (prepilin peptidase)/N-methyltransferase
VHATTGRPYAIPKYNLRKQKSSAMLLVDFEQGGVFLDAFNFFCLFFIFILGLCIGSFLNVVIYRLPGGESITLERSHCTSCGKRLRWYELIPLFSYLFLRGRCRTCHEPISLRYPLVELLTGIIFALLFLRFSLTIELVKYLFLSALLVAVSFIDLEHYIIPNSLIITGLAGGLILNIAAKDVGFVSALAGLLVTSGFLLLIALASKGGMGGGDIKLVAVTGLFLGWPLGPFGLILGAVIGGMIAVVLLLFRIKGRKDPLPFGPFIALGTFISILYGSQIINWYLQYI